MHKAWNGHKSVKERRARCVRSDFFPAFQMFLCKSVLILWGCVSVAQPAWPSLIPSPLLFLLCVRILAGLLLFARTKSGAKKHPPLHRSLWFCSHPSALSLPPPPLPNWLYLLTFTLKPLLTSFYFLFNFGVFIITVTLLVSSITSAPVCLSVWAVLSCAADGRDRSRALSALTNSIPISVCAWFAQK